MPAGQGQARARPPASRLSPRPSCPGPPEESQVTWGGGTGRHLSYGWAHGDRQTPAPAGGPGWSGDGQGLGWGRRRLSGLLGRQLGGLAPDRGPETTCRRLFASTGRCRITAVSFIWPVAPGCL